MSNTVNFTKPSDFLAPISGWKREGIDRNSCLMGDVADEVTALYRSGAWTIDVSYGIVFYDERGSRETEREPGAKGFWSVECQTMTQRLTDDPCYSIDGYPAVDENTLDITNEPVSDFDTKREAVRAMRKYAAEDETYYMNVSIARAAA